MTGSLSLPVLSLLFFLTLNVAHGTEIEMEGAPGPGPNCGTTIHLCQRFQALEERNAESERRLNSHMQPGIKVGRGILPAHVLKTIVLIWTQSG